MEYRRLGQSGLKLSALSLGSWVTFGRQLDVTKAQACMQAAFDAGINFFDNAETYASGESERVMGEVLKRVSWPRDAYCVSSKVFFGAPSEPGPTQRGLSRKHVVEACHQALSRLGVDYLDLYFCHRPDPETPIEETVRAMHDLIRQGKVLYWGTSEWSAQQIMEAYAVARQYGLTPPTMEQPEYNMFHRERVENEFARLYSEIGLGTTVWSPLASGVLTGKYNDGVPERSRFNLPGYEWLRSRYESEEGRARLAKVRELTRVAHDQGLEMAQMALAWCLHNPNVSSVILGVSGVDQLASNLEALDAVERLTPDVMERIEAILDDRPL